MVYENVKGNKTLINKIFNKQNGIDIQVKEKYENVNGVNKVTFPYKNIFFETTQSSYNEIINNAYDFMNKQLISFDATYGIKMQRSGASTSSSFTVKLPNWINRIEITWFTNPNCDPVMMLLKDTDTIISGNPINRWSWVGACKSAQGSYLPINNTVHTTVMYLNSKAFESTPTDNNVIITTGVSNDKPTALKLCFNTGSRSYTGCFFIRKIVGYRW